VKYKVKDTTNIKNNYGIGVLSARGIEDIQHFLNPTVEHSLQDWKDLDNIREAQLLLADALNVCNPKFALVVDCDVDGFTSSTIIYQYLTELSEKIKIDYYLHDGKQHGLSDICDEIIERAPYNLCIVPDAGSNDYEFIERLGEVGIKTLILDHHLIETSTKLSNYCVIVNNQTSPKYRNKDLSGAGVTYQFIRSLDERAGFTNYKKYIDLAALGICADMMSALSEENQYFWKEGFTHINNFFFQTLCEKQEYSMGGVVNPTTVAFYIVPMINAMIRVGSMDEKDRLFRAFINGKELVPSNKRGAKGTMEYVAVESARECTNAKAHQDKEKQAIVDRLKIKISNNDLLDNKVLFIRLEDDDDFPAELNGLVAMQLSTLYNRPTIVARLNSEGFVRGSARGLNQSELASFKDFLNSTKLFEYTMGHDNAFGISIKNSDLAKFHKIANEELAQYDFGENVYDVDFEREAYATDIKAIIFDLAQYTNIWGQQNNEPVIAVKDLVVRADDIQVIGKNKDTLKISKNGITYIKFFAKDLISEISKYNEMQLTIVGTANLNEWMGNVTPQILIKDIDIKEITNLSF
jgi:single-stranded-DNA-specific exonuclease